MGSRGPCAHGSGVGGDGLSAGDTDDAALFDYPGHTSDELSEHADDNAVLAPLLTAAPPPAGAAGGAGGATASGCPSSQEGGPSEAVACEAQCVSDAAQPADPRAGDKMKTCDKCGQQVAKRKLYVHLRKCDARKPGKPSKQRRLKKRKAAAAAAELLRAGSHGAHPVPFIQCHGGSSSTTLSLGGAQAADGQATQSQAAGGAHDVAAVQPAGATCGPGECSVNTTVTSGGCGAEQGSSSLGAAALAAEAAQARREADVAELKAAQLERKLQGRLERERRDGIWAKRQQRRAQQQ